MSALVIVPYFDRPISYLKEKLVFYTSLRVVSGVQVIEFDGGLPATDVCKISPKIDVVHRPNDLRCRFVSEHPCDAEYTIICDDDIYPKADLLASMMQRVEVHPTELVGVFGRQICRRTISYLSRQQNQHVDIVLTKLMIGRRDIVDRLGRVVWNHGELLGALPLNAEDIVFSMLWSHYVGRNNCLPASFTALVRDDMSKLGGLCLKKDHLQQRTEAVRKCLSQCTSEHMKQTMKLSGFHVIRDDPLRLAYVQKTKVLDEPQPRVPSRRDVLRRNRLQRRRTNNASWCETYWCKRYNEGGCSGARSYGESCIKRGRVISHILVSIGASSVIDVGCGDIHQVSQIRAQSYLGIDVSPKIISKNVDHATAFNTGKHFSTGNTVPQDKSTDVILLMDVLHCVVDDTVYDKLMKSAFLHPSAICIIIVSSSTNHSPAPHLKFRDFASTVKTMYPDWTLVGIRRETPFMTNVYKYVRSNHVTHISLLEKQWFAARAIIIQRRWRNKRGASVTKSIKSKFDVTLMAATCAVTTEFWPVVDSNDFKDRKNRTCDIIADLLVDVDTPKILDIGGVDFMTAAASKGWEYVTIDLQEPQSMGTGGYQSSTVLKYDGKTLPFEANTFDLVNVGFVLHHASENTLGLLRQIKSISRKFVIIGEDIAAQDYPMSWHERNWRHHPGGLFRSDTEWRQLFEIFGMQLRASYGVRRVDDPDDHLYRAIYILDAS